MTKYLETEDTICATATPPGRGGIAVIRVSGPQAREVSRKLASFLPLDPEIQSHRAYYGILKDPISADALDEAVVTYFAEGRSFTSQHVVEISLHGSPAICQKVLQSLQTAGARMAEPGEFTYRAFASGRLDLVQAEGVLSLIESQSSAMAKTALNQLRGGLSQELAEIEEDLTFSLANLEANIDFAQEDIEIESSGITFERMNSVAQRLGGLIQSYRRGRLLNEGLTFTLAGAPNVGKSSLLNALLCEDRAIVSDIAGTTRDSIQASLDIDGFVVHVTDTAGLRDTNDKIEQLGVARSLKLIQDADVIGYVIDQSDAASFNAEFLRQVNEQKSSDKVLLLIHKSDLSASRDLMAAIEAFENEKIFISSIKKSGLQELKNRLGDFFANNSELTSAVVTQARHFEKLSEAYAHVQRGSEKLKISASTEFVISDIQQALMCIFEILGKKFDDQVMDRVFSEFCLGK